MNSILLISPDPGLSGVVEAALASGASRVIQRLTFEEAEPLLHPQLVSLCLLDAAATDVQSIWMMEKVRRVAPAVPLVVLAGSANADWHEEAYLRGVAHVIAKPLRPRLVASLVGRLARPVAPPVPPPPPGRCGSG